MIYREPTQYFAPQASLFRKIVDIIRNAAACREQVSFKTQVKKPHCSLLCLNQLKKSSGIEKEALQNPLILTPFEAPFKAF